MQYLSPSPSKDFVPGGSWKLGGRRLWKEELVIVQQRVLTGSLRSISAAFAGGVLLWFM